MSAHSIHGLQVRCLVFEDPLGNSTDICVLLVLDPRKAELEADYADDADLAESLEKSKSALYEPFSKYYAVSKPVGGSSQLNPTSMNLPLASRSTSTIPVFDFTSRFRRTQQQSSLNKLDEYLRLAPQDFNSCNPTQWWFSQRRRFPGLYLFARDVLAIPGTLHFGCAILPQTLIT